MNATRSRSGSHSGRGRGAAALWTAGALIALTSCGLPADVGDEFGVQIEFDELILTVGDSVSLAPVVTRNGTAVDGFALAYASSDESVAVVDESGVLRGVGIGFADITVSIPTLSGAAPAEVELRVLREIAIDTVAALRTASEDGRTARWGELLEIRGVGLDPSLGSAPFVGDRAAPVHSFTAGDADDVTSLDRLTIRVPVGAPPEADVLVSRAGGSTASWSMRIRQRDVLESNQFVNVDVSAGLDEPMLALEVVDGATAQPCLSSFGAPASQCFSDGYRFQVPASGEVTIEVELDEPVVDIDEFFELNYFDPDAAEPFVITITPFWSWCLPAFVPRVLLPSLRHERRSPTRNWTMPLRLPPGDFVSLTLAQFSIRSFATDKPARPPETMRYGLRIREGYYSDLPPDASEGNDHCYGAPTLNTEGDTLDLTLDDGWDLDWFQFSLPGTREPASDSLRESEPNSRLADADTITLGSSVSGVVSPPGDVDYYTFYVDAGTLLDVDVRTPFETGRVNLDSFLQLWFEGSPIAINDDDATTSLDSRITLRVEQSGWYTAAIQQSGHFDTLDQSYTLTVRDLAGSARRLRIEAVATGPDSATAEPMIALFEDARQTALYSPDGLEEAADRLDRIIEPGGYLILIYSRSNTPTEYRLTTSLTPVG